MKKNELNVKRIYISLLLLFLLSSCADDEVKVDDGLDAYSKSVIAYFKEIALGFEFGGATKVTRRWETTMKIYVGGNPNAAHLAELSKIINEVNLLATTSFEMMVVSDSSQSNYYLFCGSGDQFGAIYPGLKNLVAANFGLFNVYWNGQDAIISGFMYVDIMRANEQEQLHLLREELTQSLGLANDSFLYPESIFQQDFATKVTEYAKIDKDLIRLLYHPEMENGLDETKVDIVLTKILKAETM
jgi:hypothetical protein